MFPWLCKRVCCVWPYYEIATKISKSFGKTKGKRKRALTDSSRRRQISSFRPLTIRLFRTPWKRKKKREDTRKNTRGKLDLAYLLSLILDFREISRSFVNESYRKFENSGGIKEDIGKITAGRQVSGKSLRMRKVLGRQWGRRKDLVTSGIRGRSFGPEWDLCGKIIIRGNQQQDWRLVKIRFVN